MKTVKEILIDARKDFKDGKYDCMCLSIANNCNGDTDEEKWNFMKKEILLFNRQIAIRQFGSNTKDMYWWPLSDKESRLRYFDWLIEQYKKKENEND